jgi:hypothetical protein
MMTIFHSAVKSAGGIIRAVLDWNAGHVNTGDLDMNEGSLDNVGDVIHDFSVPSDFTISNKDLDKDLILRVNFGGVDTDVFHIEGSTTNIGIGTSSPIYQFHCFRSGANSAVVCERDGGAVNFVNATSTYGNFGTVNNFGCQILVAAQWRFRIETDGGVYMRQLKSGATQAAAGAAALELWVTNGHASLPNGVVMIGS